MFELLTIASGALNYIIGELEKGQRLSEHLLKLPLSEGEIVAILPNEFDLHLVDDYGESIKYITGQSVGKLIEKELISIINKYLVKNVKNIVVSETLWGIKARTPSDIGFIFYDEKRLDFLRGHESSKKKIKTLVTNAKGYPTIIIGSKATIVNEASDSGEEIGDNLLSALASSTEFIIIGAFDGEGYLLWMRNPSCIRKLLA